MTKKDKNQNKKDYEVGYKRPPKAHQFKKGKPGNPNGRPKLVKAFKTDLQEELEEIITINESGKTKSTTKQRALLKRLTTSALSGNVPAIKILIGLIATMLPQVEEPTEDLSVDDIKILQKFLERKNNDGQKGT